MYQKEDPRFRLDPSFENVSRLDPYLKRQATGRWPAPGCTRTHTPFLLGLGLCYGSAMKAILGHTRNQSTEAQTPAPWLWLCPAGSSRGQAHPEYVVFHRFGRRQPRRMACGKSMCAVFSSRFRETYAASRRIRLHNWRGLEGDHSLQYVAGAACPRVPAFVAARN